MTCRFLVLGFCLLALGLLFVPLTVAHPGDLEIEDAVLHDNVIEERETASVSFEYSNPMPTQIEEGVTIYADDEEVGYKHIEADPGESDTVTATISTPSEFDTYTIRVGSPTGVEAGEMTFESENTPGTLEWYSGVVFVTISIIAAVSGFGIQIGRGLNIFVRRGMEVGLAPALALFGISAIGAFIGGLFLVNSWALGYGLLVGALVFITLFIIRTFDLILWLLQRR